MKQVAVLDFETTGVDSENDRIVTAFFGILGDNGQVNVGYNYMIKPEGYIIPDGAAEIHGVTTEQALAEGKDARAVLGEIMANIQNYCLGAHIPLGGHNLAYDLTMLDREIQRHHPKSGGVGTVLDKGLIVLDSLVIDKHIDPYRKGKRTLIATADVYGVGLSEEEAHGAQADAIASGRIIQAMLEHDPEVGHRATGPKALMENQKLWKAEQAASLQKYFRTKADPPQPDAIVDPSWPYIERPTTEGVAS